MEPKYIVAIVSVGIFAVLFLIFFTLLTYRRRMEDRLQAFIHDIYSDKNLIKFNYDAVDEDAPPILEGRVSAVDSLAVTRSEEPQETQMHMEEVFGKMEKEGIEEITGNYNPQI